MGRMSALEFAAWRHLLGLTFEDCSRLLHVTLRTVQKWESGAEQIPYGVTKEIEELYTQHTGVVEHMLSQDGGALPRQKDAPEYREFPRGWYVAAAARAVDREKKLNLEWT